MNVQPPPPPSVIDVGEDYISLKLSISNAARSTNNYEVHARLAPSGWAAARIFTVPSGSNTFTLTDLEMQSQYELRLAVIGGDGVRVVGSSLCVDTAPAGCGKRKNPTNSKAGGCVIA